MPSSEVRKGAGKPIVVVPFGERYLCTILFQNLKDEAANLPTVGRRRGYVLHDEVGIKTWVGVCICKSGEKFKAPRFSFFAVM